MCERDNADGKWSESVLEEEDSERTMNCLRGRLLAERIASRKARDQAEQLGNKMMELESLLKKEAKSRNRAEKRLKSLMKKLASMNIPFLTEESCLLDITDISSVSSTASSSTKEAEKSQKQKENVISKKGFVNLPQNGSQNCFLSLIQDSSTNEESSGSAFEVSEISVQIIRQNAPVEDSLTSAGNSAEGSQLKANDKYQNDELGVDRLPCRSVESSAIDGPKQEDDQDRDNHVDNSMALVSVHMPRETHAIDPEVLDGTVKEVLDTLRRAKEQLLVSMERRRANMIKVG